MPRLRNNTRPIEVIFLPTYLILHPYVCAGNLGIQKTRCKCIGLLLQAIREAGHFGNQPLPTKVRYLPKAGDLTPIDFDIINRYSCGDSTGLLIGFSQSITSFAIMSGHPGQRTPRAIFKVTIKNSSKWKKSGQVAKSNEQYTINKILCKVILTVVDCLL